MFGSLGILRLRRIGLWVVGEDLVEEMRYYAGDGKNEGKISVIRSRLCDRVYFICNDYIMLV